MGPRRLRQLLGPAGLAIGLAVVVAPLTDAGRPQVFTQDVQNLSGSPTAYSERPVIAVTRDGTAHVIWEEGINIVHRYRQPGERDWAPTSIVFRKGYDPVVASDGSTVVVAFVRGKRDSSDDTEILYKMWDSDTHSWPLLAEHIQRGDENIALDGQQPAVAFSADATALWLAWVDTTWGEQQLYYARVRLADHQVDGSAIDSLPAQGPAIAIGPEGSVHVAWSQQLGSSRSVIKYASRAEGSPWVIDDTAYRLQVPQARAPDIDVTPSQRCMVWHENVPDVGSEPPTSHNEIALYCNGSFWNISNSPDHSLLPSLAVDEIRGQMVVWKEHTVPHEIVFRQGPPPPPNGESMVDEGVVDSPALAFRFSDRDGQGYAHAVWTEENGGDSDIWYARWSVAVPTPTPTTTRTPTATITPTPSTTPTVTPTGTTRPPRGVIYIPHAVQTR